jgi:hypothetical protein
VLGFSDEEMPEIRKKKPSGTFMAGNPDFHGRKLGVSLAQTPSLVSLNLDFT